MLELREKLKNLPDLPGIYLFKNDQGEVIYVGKAKNLKKRVGQYFGHDNRTQIPFLISEATDLDIVVASSELESLFLENTYIKKYLPKYNIKLRDDKNYAFIKIDYSTQIPQIGYARKLENETKVKFFGPFSSALKIRKTLEFIRRVFPYCANSQIGKRPCFYYFLHRCPGVCAEEMSLEEYKLQVKRIEWFLNGNNRQIYNNLKQAMKTAARAKHYEQAAKYRDQLKSLAILEEKQVVQFTQKVNWDLVSVYIENQNGCINLFKIRQGKLVDKENFIYSGDHLTEIGVLEKFLENYYAESSDIPKEIMLEKTITTDLLEQLLYFRVKRKVKLSVPAKGKKFTLIGLGKTNAREYLNKWENSNADNLDKMTQVLTELQKLLNLPSFPSRIEGYDISNIQGTNPVGSMVVVKHGIPAKSEYRKFKIQSKNSPDDFAMMSEMLKRRLLHLTNQQSHWPKPDLIVIDGGKGQLSAAIKTQEQFHEANHPELPTIPIIGLAKRIEEIFLPNQSSPIILPHDSPVLQLLQRLRDEAHRFAITFHRARRSQGAVKSALDEIPGIGPKTKKLLKAKFGTIKKIRQASLEDLARVVGRRLAKGLLNH